MRLIFLILLPFLLFAQQHRIITLSPAISEIVYALGKGNELVGVSKFSSYPKEVLKVEKVGGYSNPSLEKILSLNPTLVIGQTHYGKILGQLNKLGIKTLSLEMSTIKKIKISIKKIADAIDANPSKLLQEINTSIKKAQTSQKNGKKVLIVYGLSLDMTRGIYIAGHNIYFEDIIHICGSNNAYSQENLAQPVLHMEGLIKINPDIVIILHHENTDGNINFKEAKELWYDIPINASKNKEVYILSQDYLSIPSQRISKTITDICETIKK